MIEIENKALTDFKKNFCSTCEDKETCDISAINCTFFDKIYFQAYKDGYIQLQKDVYSFENEVKIKGKLLAENEKIKAELERWKEEHHNQVLLANEEGWNRTQLQIENTKLKEQIEKMKIPENCNNGEYDCCKLKIHSCYNCDKWKIKEW